MMNQEKVSLVMVVHGNPPYIFTSIESAIPLISEIVFIDIGISKDLKSQLVNKKFKVPHRIIKVNDPVAYVELIREENKKHAKHDYILFNKWIENSMWWPDYQVRLFRKSKVTWPKIIHSQPQLTGNGFAVAQDERFAIIHHNYGTIDQYLSKGMRYAKAQAKERLDEQKNYTIIDSFNEGLSEFIGRFFAEKGYRDGIHGLVLATLQMFYTFLVYCYYFEGKKFKAEDRDVVEAANHFF